MLVRAMVQGRARGTLNMARGMDLAHNVTKDNRKVMRGGQGELQSTSARSSE